MSMHWQVAWFTGSVAIDGKGVPQPFFHGSSHKFLVFDKTKIRADETDAPYNGFWFTTDKRDASPAWRNPSYIMTCYLQLRAPAPHKLIRRVENFVGANLDNPRYASCRSSADAVRMELQLAGFDGVIHEDAPSINVQEFMMTGKTSYRTARGSLRYLEVDKEYDGVDFFDHNHQLITGYLDLADFMSQHSTRVFVVFEPSQINIVNIEPCKR